MAKKLHVSLMNPVLWFFLVVVTLVAAWLSLPAPEDPAPAAAGKIVAQHGIDHHADPEAAPNPEARR